MDSNPDAEASAAAKQKIVCIGDSLTLGVGASSTALSYPSILRGVLDSEKFEVQNLGVAGATMNEEIEWSIQKNQDYQFFLTQKVDAVVIMLGTMDAKDHWDEDNYQSGYFNMIQQIEDMASKPKIFIMIPPPVYNESNNYEVDQELVNEDMPYQIPDILKARQIPESQLINLFEEMGGQGLTTPGLFFDAVHPNDQGYLVIAEAVAKAMKLPFEMEQHKEDWIFHLGHPEASYFLEAVGDQGGKVLSHVNGQILLVDDVGGEGELWKVSMAEFPFKQGQSRMKLFFKAMGQESAYFMSHSHAQITLKPEALEGEEFVVDIDIGVEIEDKNNLPIVIELTGGESNTIFGHFDSQLLCLPNEAADDQTKKWILRRAA